MRALLACAATLFLAHAMPAADQLTVQRVELTGPSGSVKGKVVGIGEYLVFIDDDDPAKSFYIGRGDVKTARNDAGTVIIEMSRPVTDRFGTRSNLNLRMVDPAAAGAVTTWVGVPVERGRTTTVYVLDVEHDHRGTGECRGKLHAGDTGMRYESTTDPSHSQSWPYTSVTRFLAEKDNALLKVSAGGTEHHFRVANGATAGAFVNLVSGKVPGR